MDISFSERPTWMSGWRDPPGMVTNKKSKLKNIFRRICPVDISFSERPTWMSGWRDPPGMVTNKKSKL
ncbi:MAG: hypothetical protein AB8D52_13185, partial [Gammaproteobacteria bacterium]